MKTFEELEKDLVGLNAKTDAIESQIRESEDSVQLLGKEIVKFIADGGKGSEQIPNLQKDRTNLQTMVKDLYLALQELEQRKAITQDNLMEAKKLEMHRAFNELCDERLILTDAVQVLMDEMVGYLDSLFDVADRQDLLQFGDKVGADRYYRKKTKLVVESYLTFKLRKYLDSLGRIQFRQELSELDEKLRVKK